VARSVGSTYKPCSRLLNNVFDVVVDSAKTMNASMRLSGTIEVDGTSIRTIRVGFRSRTFQHLVNQWKATHIFNERRPPIYFLLRARFLGAVERGKSQNLVLAPAPFKLVSAGAKPPTESLEDISSTKLLRQVQIGSKLCPSPTLMADGARAWSGAARAEERRRKIKITVSHVKHCHGQFTKRVAARLKRNRIGGTQVLDRIWDGLKSSLPRQLSTRQLTGDQLKLQLNKYVWVWQWKHHKIGLGLDLLQELGKLMKSINKKIGYWK